MSQSILSKLTGASTVPPTSTEASTSDDKPISPSREMTIQPPWTKSVINLILIGETGVGKTALLNLLANVCAGIPLEEFEEKNQLKNEEGGSTSGSQTNQPHLYNITCANGYKINILDTPGLADTRGIDKDNEHKEAIANAIKKHFEVIDAVIILANGTQARLGAATEYTLKTISAMFPNSIVDNIAFIFTMVSTPASFNFDKTSLPTELSNSRIWAIDNPFAQWLKYKKLLAQDPPASEEALEETSESAQRGYTKALKVLSQFFQYLEKCKVQATHSIYELYIMSTDIESRISNVIARMSQTEDRRMKLKNLQDDFQNQASLDGHKMLSEKYERIINTPFYEHESTAPDHNTLCVAGNCFKNCHERCTVGFTMSQETLARLCASFDETPGVALLDRICKDCGHAAKDHQHYQAKWVRRIKTDKVIDPDVKKRYDAAKTESGKIAGLMETAQAEIEQLERDIIEFEKELTDLCEKFNKLSLSGSFIGYISSAIGLLKLREAALKKEGTDVEAIDRMAQRIERLEKKRKVLAEAEKPRGKRN
ncbi:hypothetical protein F5050DRAFT_1712610 [Lentinula boryana]|uniref:AIG1-type G domain-containing protein n=1 Tax=Lentinula boryana TaxID=40481 RepID=A0ABQ8QBJ2_9AGAR|nr:hypothetical protein F5050DRAFT_1712610 [Lentinula boryana]